MTTIAFVFARGGSKGLERKNLRLLGGRPLIAHAVAAARSAASVDRVLVSTDDEEIAAVAAANGAEVPWLRPPELATDDAPEWLAWKHAVAEVERTDGPFDEFVSVPTTSPLRTPDDIDACIGHFRGGAFDAVLSVRAAERNPWFNMIRFGPDGLARLCCGEGPSPSRRQAAPPVFDITTVAYVLDPRFILEAGGFFEGRVGAVEIPRRRAIDIDDHLDLEIARCLFGSPGPEA